MNNLLYFRKRLTRQQAHDYVSERHRVEDVDNKTWGKSIIVFWACIFAFGLLMAGLRYASACGELGETDGTIKQIRVDAL